MAKLRNIRAYVPGTNASTIDGYQSYDTASNESGNAILRKINLNVDIATQNELNEAVTLLSNAIQEQTSAYIPADEALSAALKEWAVGPALSGALHNEITAETDRAETAEEAIRDDLSSHYKVTLVKDSEPQTSAYVATYHVEQGGVRVGEYINIPKDYVVKSAALCTVTEAGVPYPEAEVGDKYIDFVVNTADQDDEKHIYLPVKDLVDVYTGADTNTATVTVGDDNSISVVVKDYVSKTYVDGVSSVISTAFEPRVAANEAVSQFVANMSATWGKGGTAVQSVTGDDVYLTAHTDANNDVTVGATSDLTAAVELANSAVQYAIGDDDPNTGLIEAHVTNGTNGPTVEVVPMNRLAAAVDAAETALQTISAGTDGTYVTTTVTGKDANHNQTVGVAVTVAALTADTAGLAEATDVKQYVDGKITDLSVSAAGDAYVTASSTGKEITVAAADRTKAAIDKVEATSARWDVALQEVEGGSTTYATVSVSDKADNKQTISTTVLTHTVADATPIADGIAVASDVKAYVDSVSAAIAVTAAGDNYVSAWVENGKDIKLAAQDKLTAVVSAVELSAPLWNAKADLTALEAETTARVNVDTALSTAIDNLSSTYASKTVVDDAATTLDASAAVTAKALSDYNDIDEIITELEALKAAVKTFAGTLKTA